jgi:hypothetical protein
MKLLDFALAKLNAGQPPGPSLSKELRLVGLMILCAPSVELSFQRASGLTAARMAILGYLTTSRECLQVGYPSEPVLVHAAHRLFNESSLGATTEMLNDLAKEGPRGELAARFSAVRIRP